MEWSVQWRDRSVRARRCGKWTATAAAPAAPIWLDATSSLESDEQHRSARRRLSSPAGSTLLPDTSAQRVNTTPHHMSRHHARVVRRTTDVQACQMCQLGDAGCQCHSPRATHAVACKHRQAQATRRQHQRAAWHIRCKQYLRDQGTLDAACNAVRQRDAPCHCHQCHWLSTST